MSETLIVEKNKFIELFGVELFHQAIDAFKGKARTKGLSAAEHVVYNALRGHDYKRGFTPITNEVKLKNGMSPLSGLESAKYSARWMLSNKSLPALSAYPEEQKKWLSVLVI